MTIIVDAFGGDNTELVIKGIGDAIKGVPEVKIIAVGKKDVIEELLAPVDFDRERLEIINADEVITHSDSPVMSLRRKKNSSLVVAYDTLRERDDTAALLSAGNTGSIIAGAHLLLGKREGVECPALASVIPTVKGTTSLLVDCGANVDCRAPYLVDFAKHGTEYMRTVYGIESPKVALLSVGTEDSKGNALTKEAFGLLKEAEGINFVGNMEAKTLLSGEVDVIVSDGFPGNVALKSIEGVSSATIQILAGLIKKFAPEGVDISFVKQAIGAFMKMYDFNTQGGGILLGVKKPIIKMHGSANSETVVNSVKQAVRMCNGGKVQNF